MLAFWEPLAILTLNDVNSPESLGGKTFELLRFDPLWTHVLKRQPLFEKTSLLEQHSKTNGQASKKTLRVSNLKFSSPGIIAFTAAGHAWELSIDDGKLKRQESISDVLFTSTSRSRSGGDEVYVKFKNDLETTIRAEWLDFRGNAQAYGEIPPGEQLSQHSFEKHIWRLVDPQSNDELLRFEIRNAQSETFTVSREIVDSFRNWKATQADRRRERARPNNANAHHERRPYLRDHNIYVSDQPLTSRGSKTQPFKGPLGVSPSGRYLFSQQVSLAPKRKITIIDSRPDDQIQPKTITLDYVKPGDEIDRPSVAFFDLKNASEISIEVAADERTQQLSPAPNANWFESLCPTPWSLRFIGWTKNEEAIFHYDERGHQRVRVLIVDPIQGLARVLIEETRNTFIDTSQKTLARIVNNGQDLLWASERSGFNHLYRYDLNQHKLLNAVTSGQWVFRKLLKVDEAKQRLIFMASGVTETQSPYHQHLCTVQMDGSDFRVLTDGDGDHEITFLNSEHVFLDKYSRVDMPPIHELRRLDNGKLIATLAQANCESWLARGWTVPQRFIAKGRDGKTNIHGILIFPSKLPKSSRLPIVEQVYAGPHGAHTPVRFSELREQHRIANEGFIVVQIDGMGTNHRGKKFHDVCWKNLKDAGFPDRIAWIKSAADKYPQMDLERVGIYGGSAGGQNAMRALLDHHDFYDVAVADCGCHDNRMDKIWWNEAWMGWPVDASYARSSNVEDAWKLNGRLLLIVGELDTNVDPASTLQVVDELIKHKKQFDFLILPGVGHGAAETSYGRNRRLDFLKQHLLD